MPLNNRIGIFVIFLVVAWIAVFFFRSSETRTPVVAAAPHVRTSSDEAAFETCRSKLKKAQQLEVLYDLQWEKGTAPKVVAGPTFFRLPIDAKTGFAETVNCFLVTGESGKCMQFEISSYLTGKSVAKFENCRFKML